MTPEPNARFPKILEFLLQPSTRTNRRRNSVMFGGRGGLKTYGCCDAALIRGVNQYERVLCCRDTMDSIRESVHKTLRDRIIALGLEDSYEVLESRIRGPEWEGYGRTEFIFGGLRYDPDTLKSLEGATIAWVEEAAQVCHDSWEKLDPTVRWHDDITGRESEIWVTFNPDLPTDDTYKRWILNTPDYTTVLKTSWRDNPWFPEVLEIVRQNCLKNNPEEYAHIWEGECISALKGAIYAGEYKRAVAEGRVTNVPYDRSRPVDTFWDLGYGDMTAIWFGQLVGGWYCLIDYLQNRGQPLSWYILEMQSRGYIFGTDHLPHDGVDAMTHGKLTNDRSRSPDQVLQALGRRVKIAPKLAIQTRIDATRTIFPQVRFDAEKCANGLQALQHYQWGDPSKNGQERSKPLHDWASHGADALSTFAVCAKPDKRPMPPPPRDPFMPAALRTPWS
jgi:phage terminase large subunit